MAIPEFLQGPSELDVSGPKVITSFKIFGLTINFTETVVLEWIVMAVIIGLAVGEALPLWGDILKILLLGFVSYGLSIYFYVYAQRDLGAAKTSAYYAVSPFIGVLLSFIIFREIPGVLFFIALAIMIAGTWMVNSDQPG